MTQIKSKRYNEVEILKEKSLFTGKDRFDKWFSKDGGIVWGSAIFVTGTSGAGKTTLMVNLMKWLENVKTSMYLREMTSGSTKEQTLNINLTHNNAYFVDSSGCETFEDYMRELDALQPKVVIVDSLQVIAMEDYAMKESMSEEKACYEVIKRLREWVDKNKAILFLIGHNKKDGEFAGRNTIMQMMDAHIEMVHHKKGNYRTISWGQKNRKGPMGTLYYDFEKDGIEFFTEEEWVSKSNDKRDFLNTIMSSLESYLKTIDKNSPNYSKFKVEYKNRVSSIHKIYELGGLNDVEYLNACIELVNSLSTKHSL